MRDFDEIREDLQREQEHHGTCVIVVRERFHPPCTCCSSHTDTFGVFGCVESLASTVEGMSARRVRSMTARVRPLQ